MYRLRYFALLFPFTLLGQVDTTLYSRLQIEEVVIYEAANGLSINSKSSTLQVNISRTELRKAACCNLSESFETNPSIDVAFTDAVTGTKQIQLFGLAGKYAQIQVEMTPLVRGLLSNSGLNFIPGSWVHSIQLTKGIGSVNNGFESMTGQINVELLKPEDLVEAAEAPGAEGRGDIQLNAYLNQGGRFEVNEAYGVRINKKWMLSSLGHFSGRQQATDINGDGFMDNPLGYQVNGMLRARYFGQNGWEGIYTFHALEDVKEGGQIARAFAPGTNTESLWSSAMKQGRVAFTSKMGWVNPDNPNQSVGTIFQLYSHQMKGSMGSDLPATLHSQWGGAQNGGLAQILFQHGWGTLSQTSSVLFLRDQYDLSITHPMLGQGQPWVEQGVGLSSEWTWSPLPSFTAVGGVRYDLHSIAGHQFSPRFHLRWAPGEKHTFRFNAGRGFRMALPLLEEWGRLASQRTVEWFQYGQVLGGDILSLETARNFGFSYQWSFLLNYMTGSLQADAHLTQFSKAIIHDYWTPGVRAIYPTQTQFGSERPVMTSATWGASLFYHVDKRTELRIAYRFQDLQAMYVMPNPIGGDYGRMLSVPFVAPHRMMAHLSREFKGDWTLDATLQRYSKQPIPGIDPWAWPSVDYAPAFSLLNAQIRKDFAHGDLYLGLENVLNIRQAHPIDGAMDPQTGSPLLPSDPYFQSNFDATRIWGPIFGRMVYLGTNIVL